MVPGLLLPDELAGGGEEALAARLLTNQRYLSLFDREQDVGPQPDGAIAVIEAERVRTDDANRANVAPTDGPHDEAGLEPPPQQGFLVGHTPFPRATNRCSNGLR